METTRQPPRADPTPASAGRAGTPSPRLAGVFSTGRSGSTWLGALLSSHPDVVYRFEPRTRPKGQHPGMLRALRMLESGDVAESELEAIRTGLMFADPYSDKPPFHRHAPGGGWWNSVKQPVHAISRKCPFLVPLFRTLYTPDSGMLVFKFVAHEITCRALLERTSMPVIYLVRHPCATVASILEGQRSGLMPSGRADEIRTFLADSGPGLAAQFGSRLASMGRHEHEAVLWRWSVETSLGNLPHDPSRFRLVFYENLCRDPLGEVSAVLRMLHLDVHPQVRRFVEDSTTPERRGLREAGINEYFSVFRDPARSMNHWRESLSPKEQAEIRAVVEDFPTYRLGVEVAQWA